jgi:hypothetical protein
MANNSSGYKIPAGMEEEAKRIFGPTATLDSEVDENQLKELLGNTSINNDVMRKFVDNPQSMMQMGKLISGNVNPNIMEMAKKRAMGEEGKKIQQSFAKSGISVNQLKKMAKNSDFGALERKQNNAKKSTVILITSGRSAKEKEIYSEDIHKSLIAIFKNENVNIIECPELSIGRLADKNFFLGYVESKNTNKRIKKFLQRNIGGDVILFLREGNLKINDLTYLEANVKEINKKLDEFKKETSNDLDSVLDNLEIQ